MNRLGRRQGVALVEQLTQGRALPAEVLEQILARTDGVPLFVEELTKTVLESGLLRDAGDRYELSGPLPPLAIPATLHDSLMARLDRLAAVREVAQIGAVIGREFSYELLVAVTGQPEDSLRTDLDQLVRSELIFRHSALPEATYSFKHALVHDVAYQSLLKSRRQQLHGRTAGVLEERFAEVVDLQPELLAHHWTEAGLSEKAVEYWYQAGRRASERAALAEAIGHFGKGVRAARNLAGLVGAGGARNRPPDRPRRSVDRGEGPRRARDRAGLCPRARALRAGRRPGQAVSAAVRAVGVPHGPRRARCGAGHS
jgi:predicted ATPase